MGADVKSSALYGGNYGNYDYSCLHRVLIINVRLSPCFHRVLLINVRISPCLHRVFLNLD